MAGTVEGDTITMFRAIILTFAVTMGTLFLMPADAARATDPFFEGLAGSWRGSGFVKLTQASPEENVRCRINTHTHPNGKELTVFGTCAMAGFVLPIDGSIIAKGGSSYSSTVFRTLVRLTTSSFSGRRRGARLYLRFEGRDAETKQTISSRLTIHKRKKGFDVAIQRTDPTTGALFQVGVIDFRGG